MTGEFSESKIAVDAAFAAAKEAVGEQNRGNDRAISIAQAGVREQLSALLSVTEAGLRGLEDKITDARDRITSIESLTRGIKEAAGEGRENRAEARLNNGQIVAMISIVILTLGLIISLTALILHK